MRIIYLEGFGEQERLHYREVIYSNMITSIRALINGANKLGFDLEEENKEIAEVLVEPTSGPLELTETLVKQMKALWEDEGIQEAMKHQSEFQLYDSTE